MKQKTLRVRAIGDTLVQDYQAMQGGVRRYIGRKYDKTLGGGDFNQGGWASTDHIVEIPNLAEYRMEVKLGHLEVADDETAELCGVQPLKYNMV